MQYTVDPAYRIVHIRIKTIIRKYMYIRVYVIMHDMMYDHDIAIMKLHIFVFFGKRRF